MKFCDDHWNRLRGKIEERGLADLVSTDGKAAALRTADELERETQTVANFDPLLSAFWAISGNVANQLDAAGNGRAFLYLMEPPETPEDTIEGHGEKWDGKTWPRCPLCYINIAHEVSCTGCDLETENGFDFMLDKAADDAKTMWERLRAEDEG